MISSELRVYIDRKVDSLQAIFEDWTVAWTQTQREISLKTYYPITQLLHIVAVEKNGHWTGVFSEYRERVAERERKLEAEYSSKIIALSEEVLGAKKDFEARMKSFQALQASWAVKSTYAS